MSPPGPDWEQSSPQAVVIAPRQGGTPKRSHHNDAADSRGVGIAGYGVVGVTVNSAWNGRVALGELQLAEFSRPADRRAAVLNA